MSLTVVYVICSLVGVFWTGRKTSLILTTVPLTKFFWLDFFVGCYRTCYLGWILRMGREDLQEAVETRNCLSWLLSPLARPSCSVTFSWGVWHWFGRKPVCTQAAGRTLALVSFQQMLGTKVSPASLMSCKNQFERTRKALRNCKA